MYIRSNTTTTWQDKRIKAMNRIISKSKAKKEITEHYYSQNIIGYVFLKLENKQQYKGECK